MLCLKLYTLQTIISMKALSLILLLFVSSLVAAQSPWIPKQNEGYLQLGLTNISSYQSIYVGGTGDYRLNREVSDITLQLYGEYGIANKLGLMVSVPFKMLATGDLVAGPTNPALTNQQGDFTTPGNISLALKRNFIDGGFLLSGQLEAELPTGSLDVLTGLRSGVDALTLRPTLTLGKGSSKWYGYCAVGSSIRSNYYSSDIKIAAEAGMKQFDRLWVVLVLDVVHSFENGSATGEQPIQQAAGLYLNNQEYFAFGLKGIFEVNEKLGINGAMYGAASGNLVAKAPSINFGVYYKW